MTSVVISDADQGFVLKGNLIANLWCLFQVETLKAPTLGLYNWKIQLILFALISI